MGTLFTRGPHSGWLRIFDYADFYTLRLPDATPKRLISLPRAQMEIFLLNKNMKMTLLLIVNVHNLNKVKGIEVLLAYANNYNFFICFKSR